MALPIGLANISTGRWGEFLLPGIACKSSALLSDLCIVSAWIVLHSCIHQSFWLWNLRHNHAHVRFEVQSPIDCQANRIIIEKGVADGIPEGMMN